jgi:hypothetical protein
VIHRDLKPANVMVGAWRTDDDLAGVRDAAALENLSEPERKDWQKLWSDADALLQKAQPKE